MSATNFPTIYSRYAAQYQEAARLNKTEGLTKELYIQLAMLADSLSYQEALLTKFDQLEKAQKKQEVVMTEQQQWANRFEEVLKGTKK